MAKFPKRPAHTPTGANETAAERRGAELAECLRRIQGVLAEYTATFAVQQTMTLDTEARPRYSYSVNIVSA